MNYWGQKKVPLTVDQKKDVPRLGGRSRPGAEIEILFCRRGEGKLLAGKPSESHIFKQRKKLKSVFP